MKELDILIDPSEYKQPHKDGAKHRPADKFARNKLPIMDKNNLHKKTLQRILHSNLQKKVRIPGGLHKLSMLLDGFYQKNDWQLELEQAVIIANWDKIMGKILSEKTTPKWSKSGKLIIECSSPALVNEVKHYINVIYYKINKYSNILPEISVSGPTKL